MPMVVRIARHLKHLWQTLVANGVDLLAIRHTSPVERTLLVVHLDAIGDYVIFRNFLSAVRQSPRYRGYRITLCGNQQYRDLAETLDRGVVDDFIWLDRNRFRHNVPYRFRMVRQISGRGFATAIHPAYSRTYYWGDTVVRASGAPERIGTDGDMINCLWWQKRMADRYYTRRIATPPGYLFEFTRIRLFFQEITGEEIPLAKPAIALKPDDEFGIGGAYAVLFPGGSVPFKLWSAGNYATVARHLASVHGLKVVLAGSSTDIPFARMIGDELRSCPIIDLTGTTTLPALARLIAGARLLVSNETSAVHIAVAVGTRVVCIATGHQFGRFYPYPAEAYDRIRYAYPPELTDSPDNVARLWEKYFESPGFDVNSILPDQVNYQADLLLASGGGAGP